MAAATPARLPPAAAPATATCPHPPPPLPHLTHLTPHRYGCTATHTAHTYYSTRYSCARAHALPRVCPTRGSASYCHSHTAALPHPALPVPPSRVHITYAEHLLLRRATTVCAPVTYLSTDTTRLRASACLTAGAAPALATRANNLFCCTTATLFYLTRNTTGTEEDGRKKGGRQEAGGVKRKEDRKEKKVKKQNSSNKCFPPLS